jgi:hypothetical protein
VEQGQKLMRYLKRDFDQAIIDIKKLEGSAKAKLNPSRLGAGPCLYWLRFSIRPT